MILLEFKVWYMAFCATVMRLTGAAAIDSFPAVCLFLIPSLVFITWYFVTYTYGTGADDDSDQLYQKAA